MNTQAATYGDMSHEEIGQWLDKGLAAMKRGDYEEAERIAKLVPISPSGAKIFQLVYGDDYLEANGYNTSGLTNHV